MSQSQKSTPDTSSSLSKLKTELLGLINLVQILNPTIEMYAESDLYPMEIFISFISFDEKVKERNQINEQLISLGLVTDTTPWLSSISIYYEANHGYLLRKAPTTNTG